MILQKEAMPQWRDGIHPETKINNKLKKTIITKKVIIHFKKNFNQYSSKFNCFFAFCCWQPKRVNNHHLTHSALFPALWVKANNVASIYSIWTSSNRTIDNN